MSKRLARLLDWPAAESAKIVNLLESAVGWPGLDISILQHTHQLTRQKITSLGLDPTDTTPAELHHGLLAKY